MSMYAAEATSTIKYHRYCGCSKDHCTAREAAYDPGGDPGFNIYSKTTPRSDHFRWWEYSPVGNGLCMPLGIRVYDGTVVLRNDGPSPLRTMEPSSVKTIGPSFVNTTASSRSENAGTVIRVDDATPWLWGGLESVLLLNPVVVVRVPFSLPPNQPPNS